MKNKKLPSSASANIEYNLLSHISHEVRGPFNGLIGFSDLLNTHYETLSDESKIEYIHIINQLASKSYLQVQTLIIWLKLISNNVSLNFSNVDLYDTIKNSIIGLSNDIESKKINIIYPLKNASIEADNQLLLVALSNILSISIRTLAEQHEITLTHHVTKTEHCIMISWLTSIELVEPILPFLNNQNQYDEHTFRFWIASQILQKHSGKLTLTIDNNCVTVKIHIPTKSLK
jgi:two-component system sensor histidine kinase/response regulator